MSYNQEKVDRDLREKTSDSSDFQRKVVAFCMAYIKASANEMSKYYPDWDNNDYIYRGYRSLDKDDKDSVKEGTPPKIIVPITYAQTQTALSFIFSTFTQRRVLFELLAGGPEDENNKLALEQDIDYQMSNQKALLKLYLYLLDHCKYGFGVMKLDWYEKYMQLRVAKQEQQFDIMSSLGAIFGKPSQPKFTTIESVQDVLEYQGNRLTNITPYSFYPDPSVTLANFQDGKFVGHDTETSLTAVQEDEGKDFHGTDKIPETISSEEMRGRTRRTGSVFADMNGSDGVVGGSGTNKPRVCVKLEVTFIMSEKEATEEFGFDCGSNTKPIKWLAVISNDKKLIQFKPAGYLHNKFNYCLSEYSPDNNSFYNPGLSDTIYELQNLISFFLNSHVVNVKKIIQNRFVGDESKIYKEDITSNAAFIRLKQSGLPIDRIIQQLQVSDVTRQHVGDMDTLVKLVQVVTGINENALGQYSQGRRSATEARSVNAGAAARLKMFSQLMWLQGLEPAGRQILANTRQGRTKEVYEQIVGAMALKAPFEQAILANPNRIAGGYDFVPYDATLPSDKSFQAGVFQELFTTLLQNPNSMQLLNKSPIKLLNHIAELYGIKNLQDFDLTPEQSLPPLEANVQGDQQVGEQVRNGQVAPVPTAESLIQGLIGQ